jgi:hypothetical protein
MSEELTVEGLRDAMSEACKNVALWMVGNLSERATALKYLRDTRARLRAMQPPEEACKTCEGTGYDGMDTHTLDPQQCPDCRPTEEPKQGSRWPGK